METILSAPAPRPASVLFWRDTIAPKEHGSWSLAFEPIALSILVAPSAAGVLLAVVLGGGFFARRPARILRGERRAERRAVARAALAGCLAVVAAAGTAISMIAGIEWLLWMVPMAVAGVLFAAFDLRGDGREEAAEVAGAAAFGLAPVAFAALAGWSPAEALALAMLAVGRAVPSVLCVRAFVRGAKTGARRDAPAMIAAAAAVAGAVACFERGLVPMFAVLALAAFALRAIVLLVVRPAWRARTVGMIEAILGVLFVAGLAVVWRG